MITEKRHRPATHTMKTKRKGSGRKKGQIFELTKKGHNPQFPLGELIKLAKQGDRPKDAFRVCEHLRALAWKLHHSPGAPVTRREAYCAIEQWMDEARKSPEIFETLWLLINAFEKRDVPFFASLTRMIAAMEKNNAAPDTLTMPPADPEMFWLGKLKEYYEAEQNVFCPPFFTESVSKILSLPKTKRPPLTLNQIGDFLQLHLTHRPSDSWLSSKAKLLGIPVHLRFGKRR